jgi:hypothetical protein
MSRVTTLNTNESNKDLSEDINLEKNGTRVKLSDELALMAMKRRDTADQFSLHHTVFVIECGDSTDTHDLHDTVGSLLAKSAIHWNVIDFDTHEKNISGQPDIFRHLRSTHIMTAAQKAGIVPSSLRTGGIAFALLLVVCFGIAGLIRLVPGHGPLSGTLERTFFSGWPLMMIAGASALIGWIFFSFFHRIGLASNNNIRIRIIDHAKTIAMEKQYNDPFTKKIENSFLGLDMPMALVINNPGTIDAYTQHVFSHILSSEIHSTVGLILWIVLKKDIRDPITDCIMALEKQEGFRQNIVSYHYRVSHPDKPMVQRKKTA